MNSPAGGASGRVRDALLEQEGKYVVADVHAALVLGWLAATCQPDGLHATNRVCSIYFDTPTLELLDEKRNSDYLKRKVRVRWYAPADGSAPAEDGQAMLEAKCRIGTYRYKTRIPTPYSGAEVASMGLHDPRLAVLPEQLRHRGITLPPFLVPVFRIDYIRRRFVHEPSGRRISFDSGIEVPAVAGHLIPAPPGARLATAVLEVKGSDGDLPPGLTGLAARWVRRGAFSKYLACFEKLARR
ncbi:MAG TPA: VTC domain-containing protein [Vicinamibacterales bacterium]